MSACIDALYKGVADAKSIEDELYGFLKGNRRLLETLKHCGPHSFERRATRNILTDLRLATKAVTSLRTTPGRVQRERDQLLQEINCCLETCLGCGLLRMGISRISKYLRVGCIQQDLFDHGLMDDDAFVRLELPPEDMSEALVKLRAVKNDLRKRSPATLNRKDMITVRRIDQLIALDGLLPEADAWPGFYMEARSQLRRFAVTVSTIGDLCTQVRSRQIPDRRTLTQGVNTMSRPRIFISYSHADEAWKDRLLSHLEVLCRENLLDVFHDRMIAAGDELLAAIISAINSADAAILLISSKFLSSQFIRGEEVPRLLRRRKSEGILLCPLILRACPWKSVEWLAALQCRPTDGSPLNSMQEHEIDMHLAALATEIAELSAVR